MEKELYEQLLNLPHLKVDGVHVCDKTININCHLSLSSETCASCSKSVQRFKSYQVHTVRDLDISGRFVYLHVRVKQFYCDDCGKYFTQSLPFADAHKSYTHRQSKWIFEMSRKQPLSEVAALTNLCTKTVERIFFDHAHSLSTGRYEGLKQLGIDEFAWRKGKKDYICCLTNLETGETVDILRSRKKQDLIAHFKSISLKNGQDFCQNIQVISCDFWGPFLDIAQELFPKADVVGDRFHWTGYLNKALDDQRKALRKDQPKEDLFKGIKWLLFRPMNTLTPEEKENLDKAFQVAPVMAHLYELKNAFCRIFDTQTNLQNANELIENWLIKATKSGNEYLNNFIDFFKRQRTTITNYFKHKVSNAVTEGNNNILRTVKRFTFNMTNFDHFKARCFAFKEACR
jgi:transposase